MSNLHNIIVGAVRKGYEIRIRRTGLLCIQIELSDNLESSWRRHHETHQITFEVAQEPKIEAITLVIENLVNKLDHYRDPWMK